MLSLFGDPQNQIVAVCDVHKEWHRQRIRTHESLRDLDLPLFTDYREMYDAMGDQIDAVTVDDVQELASSLLTDQAVALTVLGPISKGEVEATFPEPTF